MGLSEVLILVAAVAGFATGYLAAVLRHGDTKAGTPSASHNRQITKPAACEKCDYDYASIVCSMCGTWIINKRRQAS